jgi:hypothetical protein
MVKIISLAKNCWEEDFIFKDLLPKGLEVLYFNNCLDVIIPEEDYILIFTSGFTCFEHMKDLLKKKNPLIIFMISDENGVDPFFNELSKYTKLFIRQYHHYHYPSFPNIVYMPLGYMRNMIGRKSTEFSVTPINERSLKWSFVGDVRENRVKMIKKFRSSGLVPYCLINGITPSEMFNVYSNTIFVPNDRGHSSLDCLRLYEASLCGAIPVVVGSMDEICKTFMKEECPPWIFASSWKKAIKVCRNLLNNPFELQKRQTSLIYWWYNRVETLRLHILRTLN